MKEESQGSSGSKPTCCGSSWKKRVAGQEEVAQEFAVVTHSQSKRAEEEAKEGVDAVAREEVITALPLPTEEMEGDEEGELELEAASEEETLKRNP